MKDGVWSEFRKKRGSGCAALQRYRSGSASGSGGVGDAEFIANFSLH